MLALLLMINYFTYTFNVISLINWTPRMTSLFWSVISQLELIDLTVIDTKNLVLNSTNDW